MKKLAIIAGSVFVVVALVTVYYYSAWSAARAAALADAASDSRVFVTDPARPFAGGVPASELRVQTGSGWFQPSNRLAFPFRVFDSSTQRSIDLAVDVELTPRGWQVVRVGNLDG